MTVPLRRTLAEQAGFICFLGLALVSAGVYFLYPDNQVVRGGLLFLWCALVLVRLRALTPAVAPVESASLPLRLMETLAMRLRRHKTEVAARLTGGDMVFWTTGGLMCLAWIACNAVFPADSSVPLRAALEEFWRVADIAPSSSVVWTDLLAMMAVLLTAGAAVVIAQTHAYDRRDVRMAALGLIPVFAVAAFWALAQGAPVQFVWPDRLSLLGTGFMTGAEDASSPLMQRYARTGFAGVMLVYAAGLAPAAVLARRLAGGQILFPAMGLAVLALMATADMFRVPGPAFLPLMLTGWIIVGLCWGQAAFSRNTQQGLTLEHL